MARLFCVEISPSSGGTLISAMFCPAVTHGDRHLVRGARRDRDGLWRRIAEAQRDFHRRVLAIHLIHAELDGLFVADDAEARAALDHDLAVTLAARSG